MKNVVALLLTLLVAGCARDVVQRNSGAPNPEPAPLQFFVTGEVRKPGVFDWRDGLTVSNAIQQAGGFTDFAPRRLELLHWDGASEKYRLDSHHRLKTNPLVRPGDRIHSPRPGIIH